MAESIVVTALRRELAVAQSDLRRRILGADRHLKSDVYQEHQAQNAAVRVMQDLQDGLERYYAVQEELEKHIALQQEEEV